MEERRGDAFILETWVYTTRGSTGSNARRAPVLQYQKCMMSTVIAWARPLDHPKGFLVLSFITWKLILLCVALASPGPGYDTSTVLLHSDLNRAQTKPGFGWEPALRLRSLVRWDAIYYTQLARRGYLWEQEWAFGWGFSNLVGGTSRSDCYAALSASHETNCL